MIKQRPGFMMVVVYRFVVVNKCKSIDADL